MAKIRFKNGDIIDCLQEPSEVKNRITTARGLKEHDKFIYLDVVPTDILKHIEYEHYVYVRFDEIREIYR